jgi:hypothetical protein
VSNENKFIDGLIVKAPHENAPDYVIAKLSIKRAELIAWLEAQDGEWINADIKESQGGKYYAAVDTWKPEGGGRGGNRGGAPQRERAEKATDKPTGGFADDFADDDIPFLTNRSTF